MRKIIIKIAKATLKAINGILCAFGFPAAFEKEIINAVVQQVKAHEMLPDPDKEQVKKSDTINLYWVRRKGDIYIGMYVFAETPNKARAMATHEFSDDEDDDYINLRAQILKKNVGGNSEIITSLEDEGFARVLAAGYRYTDSDNEDMYY
jgi:hypothetical protein